MMKNQKGMSLVTVMVAMAISAIIGLAVMEMSKNMSKMLQFSGIETEMQQQMALLQISLSDEHTCLANFGGLTLGTAAIDLPSDASHRLRFPASTGSLTLGNNVILPSQDPATPGQPILVEGLSLKPFPGSSNIRILEVRFQAKDSSVFGGALKPREIPLRIATDAAHKVVRCTASTSFSESPGEDDDTGGSQGHACPSPGIVEMPFVGGRTPGSNSYRLKADDFSGAVQQLCDRQTYPVQGGLVVPKADIESCMTTLANSSGGTTSDAFRRCSALVLIAGSENGGQLGTYTSYGDHSQIGNIHDVVLSKRKGYADKAACLQQKPFSESDTIPHATFESGTSCSGGSPNSPGERCTSWKKWSGFQPGPLCINSYWSP